MMLYSNHNYYVLFYVLSSLFVCMINVNEFKKQSSLIIYGGYQIKNHLQFNDVYMRFLTERFSGIAN
jgi:hypothetical protein